MAVPPERNRQCSDEPWQNRPQHHRPVRKAKAAKKDIYPPEFWDNLSKVPLTPLALRELDRRNKNRSRREWRIPTDLSTDLGRFAGHGGPNLCHLRGYPEAKDSTGSSTPQGRQTKSTKATGKSSAYGKEFECHLIDHHIYPADHDHGDDILPPEPKNLDQIQKMLMVERASLSPSLFTPSAFRDFKRKNHGAVSENDVMSKVVPTISGTSSIPNQQNVLFTELKYVTNETAVKPKPDFFDGARWDSLDQEVKNDEGVRSTVIPTKHARVPVAPNFFLEAKARDGSLGVLERQACYFGAHGVRAMHALQNYGKAEPTYDGNAYTFSATYHPSAALLQLYAHHATAPSTQDGRPEYHMTRLYNLGMNSDIDTFRRGVTAFRNTRDLAQTYRNTFIEAANTRASQAGASGHEDVEAPNEDSIYGRSSAG